METDENGDELRGKRKHSRSLYDQNTCLVEVRENKKVIMARKKNPRFPTVP